jgi:hypothetical protein
MHAASPMVAVAKVVDRASMVEMKSPPSADAALVAADIRYLRGKVTECVEVLVNLYRLFGFDDTGYARKPTVDYWVLCCQSMGKDGWLAWAKYKLAAFFSFHMGQELPKCPVVGSTDNPGILLSGRAYRWQRYVLTLNEDTKFYFLSSIKYAKRAMPRPPREVLEQSALETVIALTSERKQKKFIETMRWADINEIALRRRNNQIVGHLTLDTAKEQLRRTVRELFKDCRYTIEDRLRPFFPSTSANYIRSRAMSGAVGACLEDPSLLRGLRGRNPITIRSWGDMMTMAERLGGRVEDLGSVLEGRTRQDVEEHIEQESSGNFVAFLGELRERFRKFYWRVLRSSTREVPVVEALPLAESLKVRVISKGPPMLYTALKPLQRYMWSVLKDHPAFSLIGQPISAQYIHDRMGSRLEDGEIYLSGDYKAATDNIAPWASETVADELSRVIGLSEEESNLFRVSLTGHRFHSDFFVGDNWRYGNTLAQRWGQLMGSITSFPVLCMINAAACRFCLEESTGRKWSLKDARLAINGDDVVMRGPALLKEVWRNVTQFFGLQESVGKTYFARDFLEMNSTLFRRVDPGVPLTWSDGAVRVSAFVQASRVNMGLIYGLTRSSGKVGVGDAVEGEFSPSIGSRARQLFTEAPESMRGAVMRMFINRQWDVLSSVKVPWFMPEWVGGLGLPSFWCDRYYGPTALDLSKGVALVRNGLIPDIGRPREASNWVTHLLVMQRLPNRIKDAMIEQRAGGDIDRLYGAACVSLLFDQSVVLSDLYDDEPDKGRALRQLRSNELLWTRVAPRSGEFPFWQTRASLPVDVNVFVTE